MKQHGAEQTTPLYARHVQCPPLKVSKQNTTLTGARSQNYADTGSVTQIYVCVSSVRVIARAAIQITTWYGSYDSMWWRRNFSLDHHGYYWFTNLIERLHFCMHYKGELAELARARLGRR